jgi:hypothetical protein
MDVHDVAVEGLNIGAKTTSFGGPFTHMYTALITMVLQALLGLLSQGKWLRGRQTIQSCVEGVGNAWV